MIARNGSTAASWHAVDLVLEAVCEASRLEAGEITGGVLGRSRSGWSQTVLRSLAHALRRHTGETWVSIAAILRVTPGRARYLASCSTRDAAALELLAVAGLGDAALAYDAPHADSRLAADDAARRSGVCRDRGGEA